MRAFFTISFLSFMILAQPAFAQPAPPQTEISALVADLRGEKALRRYEALEKLAAIGPAAKLAVLELERMLVDRDELTRVLAASALVRIEPGDAERRTAAAQALGRTMRETTRSEIRREAASALGLFGAEAVPVATAALGDQLPETRTLSAETLAHLGAVASKAVPTLIKLLDDPDATVRAAAARALGIIGRDHHLSIPSLTLGLQDPAPAVRAASAEALGAFGPAAKDAAKALALTLQDDEHDCCRAAAGALERLGVGAKEATPELINLFEKDNDAASAHAACALVNVGDEAVPLLITAMKNKKARYWVMMALAEMGTAAKPAIPELVRMLDDEDPNLRREVLLCLAGIGSGAETALPKIADHLNDTAPSVQQAAAFALGNLGAESSKTRAALLDALEGNDALLAVVAARSLLLLDGGDESAKDRARQLLLARAEHPDVLVRVGVIKAFGEIPEPTAAMQAILIRSLRASEPPSVVSSASETLVQIGETALPSLVSALRNPETRLGALIIMGRIGPKAQKAVPAIAYWLEYLDPEIQHASLIALGSIGPGARRAIPAIERALRDGEDRRIRDAAAYALDAIAGGNNRVDSVTPNQYTP